MANERNRTGRSAQNGQFVVGAMASERISKVEGLGLSKDMRKMFNDFERKGVTAAARRKEILGKYGKKGG